jgi:hypothetical protein
MSMNVVHVLVDLRLRHAQQRPAQVNVFASRRFAVDAERDIDQGPDFAFDLGAAMGRRIDAA